MPEITINEQIKNISQELYDYLLNTNSQELVEWLSVKKQKREGTPEAHNNSSEDKTLFFSPGFKLGRLSYGSTASTLQGVTADISKIILLRSEIVNNKIKITTNRGQRADTSIPGSQGDHVTAYVTLLQTICSIVDGEDVHETPQILYDTTKCFFGDKAGQEIKLKNLDNNEEVTFDQKLEQIKKLFFPRDLRKNLTKHLRIIKEHGLKVNQDLEELQKALQFLAKQDKDSLNIDQLRDCLKRSNQTIFAQLIVELGEKVLETYNQSPTAAFPKLKIDKEGSSEGNRVKGAMKDLRLVNKFLELKINLNKATDQPEEQQLALVNEFIEQCENIIKTSKPQITTVDGLNKDFNEFFKKVVHYYDEKILMLKVTGNHHDNVKALLTHFKNINLEQINASKIGEWFNNLFDFKEQNIIKAEEGEPEGALSSDPNNKIKVALKRPEYTLYEVTARHINFMFIAFKNLNHLSPSVKVKIIKAFTNKIISDPDPSNKKDNAQGWKNYVIPGQFGDPNINLNEPIVSDGIKSLCRIYKDAIDQQLSSCQPQL